MKRLFSHGVKRRLIAGFLVTVGCFAVLSGVGSAQSSSRFGNSIFKPPDGWKRLEQSQALVFVPNDLQQGQRCLLALLPGQELQGDFRKWFDSALSDSLKGERVVSRNEPAAQRADEGYDTLYTVVVTESKTGQQEYRFYLAAHPGTRAEMLAFLAAGKEVFDRYQPVLMEFIKNWNFANVSAKPTERTPDRGPSDTVGAARPASSGGLEGLYVGTESRQQFNVLTKYYDYIVRQIYYLFLPDGRVYYGLPKGGSLSRFDFARAQREDPKNCGTYRLLGNQIQFNWPDSKPNQPVAFSRSPDGIQIGRTRYYRVGRFDGLRLDGTYSVRSFTNTSAPGVEGGVSGEKRITFSQDGRFSQQGFVGFAGATQGGSGDVGAATRSQSSGSGTYRISDNTLELSYSDGRRQRYTFFVYPENVNQPRPGLIVIDGTSYLLR